MTEKEKYLKRMANYSRRFPRAKGVCKHGRKGK